MSVLDRLMARLRAEEGMRSFRYLDSLGHATIGYGYLLEGHAVETMRAIGRSPSSRATPASARSTADAPSLIPELLPAVTVPPSRNAGRRRARASTDVSARGCSSRLTRTASPFRCGTVIGTI